MKRILISAATVFSAMFLTSCDGEKKEGQAGSDSALEQAVPKTPGEELLAVMLVIQDHESAEANATQVREIAAKLPKDMPHDESVSIMNEMLRFASRECYGSLALENALRGIKFESEEYTDSAPLEVEGYEPTPDDKAK